MKISTTKNALLMSILSLFLCFAMLTGTTFAWFTDTVESGVNQIVAGNLDADVYYGDPADEKSIQGVSELFDDVKLWEPGVVAYENLTVVNKGNLSLKYRLSINFDNENYILDENGDNTYCLADILKVGFVEGGLEDGLTREEALAKVPDNAWIDMSSFSKEETLLAGAAGKSYGIVIAWKVSDEDNNWNLNNGKETNDGEALHIDLGVTLFATQVEGEFDSFDDKYDEDAPYATVVVKEAGVEKAVEAGNANVVVPAGAPAGSYTLPAPEIVTTVDNATNNTVLECDITLSLDGNPISTPTAGVEYTVELYVGEMLTIFEVYHKNEKINTYDYDPVTGILKFTTDSFSPFKVICDKFAEELVMTDENKIIHGTFKGVNPAIIDPSLAETDSKYIAVDYEKDGVTYYRVSERATTKIVSPDGSDYSFENKNIAATTDSGSGKLWSIISGLQNNEHSTVYLLPGTYNEATTIYVYSSMDIIGLGDIADVKVVKQSSSSSNRHLFNANGTKAEYIEVTIRNMTLDATEKTANSKDNAAVQSIRKSKVKCYDLDIIKGTGWDAVAIYVNGNNAVDGVKYPAYLYAENCTLNTTRTFGVVTTSGTYKFYHQGLTYGGTAYTNNSGSIKNVKLDWNDWDWEN